MKHYLLLLFFTSTLTFSQQTKKVDFIKGNAIVTPHSLTKSITGVVNYEFNVLSAIDTIKIDAQNMTFDMVRINESIVNYKNTGKELQLFEGFKKGKNTLKFNYKATPKQTLYFTGDPSTGSGQIWTQGQGKYTSHWLPSFDDVNEKVIFNLTVIYDKNYEVLTNGIYNYKKRGVTATFNPSNTTDKMFHYSMDKPMSSYLLMLAIGKFDKKTATSKSGIPLEMYYEPNDSAKFEPTYRYSKQIFDFLEKEIGVSYPWEIYKQIPVRDFLYAGMENTSATIFSQDYVVDVIGFNDRNYVNVNAHELAHQWFGDMVTAENGKHHWLQEGFATYYALLAEKQIFGDDYFYYKLYQSAQQLKEVSKHDTIPILNEKASSLTYYQKGAWALYVLRDGVGEKIFRKVVKNFLKKHAFQNVNTEDFFTEISKLSKYDLKKFSAAWLEQSGFDSQKAEELLSKNESVNTLFEIQKLRKKPLNEKKYFFEKTLQSNAYFFIKEEIISQLEEIPFEDKSSLIRLAMKSNDFKVRQMIAKTMPKIPLEFKEEYLSLLDDKSYITQEIALNTFWSQFPEQQKQVLDKTKNWTGFNDKNLRILWLTLALGTKDYERENKMYFYDELLDYCSLKFDGSIRQNALENLLFINKNDQNLLPYLVNATTNHRWQFSKFARENIRMLLKNKNHRTYFEELLPKLSESEKTQLNKLLKE